MSEGSLPPFKYLDPRRYPARLRSAVERLIGRLRASRQRDGARDDPEVPGNPGIFAETPARDLETVTYPEERGIIPGRDGEDAARPSSHETGDEVGEADRERAAAALREFLAQNATNLDRASRLEARAERLEREGTPSDSAHNRAERARQEVVDGLVRLRRSLSGSGETGPARALESEIIKLDPPISPGEIHR